MSILEEPLVFIDVETTGLSYSRGRVFEVAAIRVENGKITDTFSSLVDPQTELPDFITGLTGISRQDLVSAPTFYDIANDLAAIMDESVLVAHNARFDYAFLKQEYKRLGQNFSPKLLCTYRLSKALYPGWRSYKLGDLIDGCGLRFLNRHRAFDDAKAVLHFVQHAQRNFPAPVLEAAIKLQLKSPSLPKHLSPDLMNSLPQTPGVYVFEDGNGSPLYIGKSVNIKKRVMSHFSAYHQHEGEFKINQQVHHVKTYETNGELAALLLESRLIKDLQPLYNRQLRRHQKLTLVRQKILSGGYIGLDIKDTKAITPDEIKDILGVYTTKGKARDYLNQMIKDYDLCPKLIGFEKGRSCFLYQLKKCRGACLGQEPAEEYNHRLLDAFAKQRLQEWPYNTPVIIEEPGGEALSGIVVDQWCVLASIRQEPDCEPLVKFQTKAFDIDTYKILRSYLSGQPRRVAIKPVSLEQLYSMSPAGV